MTAASGKCLPKGNANTTTVGLRKRPAFETIIACGASLRFISMQPAGPSTKNILSGEAAHVEVLADVKKLENCRALRSVSGVPAHNKTTVSSVASNVETDLPSQP